MALHLYRRHFRNGRCAGTHPPDSQSYESDELRPKWRKCACPIYASGTLGDNPKFRRNTQRFIWAEARAVAEAWEQQGGPEPPPPSRPPAAPEPQEPAKARKTITDAAAAVLEEYRTNDSAIATLRRYQTVMKKFCQFSTDVKAYVYLDQWQTEDVREFRRWWTGCSTRTHNTNIGHLKTFFEFCKSNKWIADNPARFRVHRSRNQAAASRSAQKSPYTDEEIERMLAACDRYAKTWRHKWGGQDLKDFILISAYTGLRISDMATFHMSRMSPQGDVHFRALKNGNWVDTWVPGWLQKRIEDRAAKHGPYIFGARETDSPITLGNPWRVRLGEIWEDSGPWPEPPTHHRFRHTFVRILLERGVPVGTVAELLGDTEEVVRKAYSKWVPGRQERVRAVLQEAFSDRPRLTRVK